MDWFEYRNFGDLSFNSCGRQRWGWIFQRAGGPSGTGSTIKDQVVDGGISSRVSTGFVFADTSMVHYSSRAIHWVYYRRGCLCRSQCDRTYRQSERTIQWLSFCILVCKRGETGR